MVVFEQLGLEQVFVTVFANILKNPEMNLSSSLPKHQLSH